MLSKALAGLVREQQIAIMNQHGGHTGHRRPTQCSLTSSFPRGRYDTLGDVADLATTGCGHSCQFFEQTRAILGFLARLLLVQQHFRLPEKV